MLVRTSIDDAVARIASAIGEPARARMLYSLLDRHARTSTELAVIAEVTPSTASAHLRRLCEGGLVRVLAQGKHRYHQLESAGVADVLERLAAVAGAARPRFIPSTPGRLRTARTCYDHLAGTLAVALHDRLLALGWLAVSSPPGDDYVVTPGGTAALSRLGVDLALQPGSRRRLAFGCLDWSERRFHLGGSVGASLLGFMLRRRWLRADLDSRALDLTDLGRREFKRCFGIPA